MTIGFAHGNALGVIQTTFMAIHWSALPSALLAILGQLLAGKLAILHRHFVTFQVAVKSHVHLVTMVITDMANLVLAVVDTIRDWVKAALVLASLSVHQRTFRAKALHRDILALGLAADVGARAALLAAIVNHWQL